MKYTMKEDSYIDKETKARLVIGNITVTGCNEEQYNKIRDIVIALYSKEREVQNV